jgi:hypothetical protein
MPTRHRILTAVAVLAIALIAGACAGSGANLIDDQANGPSPASAPEAAGEGARQGDVDTAGSGAIGGLTDDAKIVRTGSLELEVNGFAEALTRARAAIAGLGGYIAASEERHEAERDFATVTYRIPADRWDDAVDALRGIATTILGERTQAVEVTSQLVDLEARISNLRATEQALVAIMAKATRIPDILEVQAQLTTVRSEIEQLEAQRAQLEDQASYGTLSVAWSTPVAPVVETQQAWNPAAEIERAVAALLSVGQIVATVGIWLLIVGLPLLVGVGVVAAVVWAIMRRTARHAPEGAGTPAGG